MAEENKNPKSKIAEREEEILKFWQENKIFEKSLEKEAPMGEFVFYDGPPFATGSPHYGHLLAGTIKDIIPRYKTMRGFKVPRKWGWDCHGLPVENIIEKELKLSSKKDIENFGVKKFNEAAKNAVMRYADEWKRVIPRVGRFVDMEDDYKTMDTSYTESVWWAFKNLYDKDLVYKSFKAMHLCPHCETTLSNFEVNQGYKDITDVSVYVKFAVVGKKDTYFLAWTTTPWTLPGNVALAVNKDVEYARVKKGEEIFILAKDLVEKVLKTDFEVIEEFKGKKLLGQKYEPLFNYYQNAEIENIENGWKVYHGDFVTTEDGTGIVHIAPAFGEEDMELGKSEKLPFVQHVNVDGTFKKDVIDFVGRKVKPKENPQEADVEILKFLAKAGSLFEKEKFTHSYPHCWRCDTPLLNFATTSWFVKVSDLKDKLVKTNKKISWMPKEIGENRFGKWLEGARDWAISRSRYWGAPLPVWQNEDGDNFIIGSIEELKKYTKKSGNKYFVVRHGEADHNVKNLVSNEPDHPHYLTEKGKQQAIKAGEKLKKEKIDAIYCSPFIRTKETAKIIAEAISFPEEKIIYDDRIRELDFGDFDLKSFDDFIKYEESSMQNFDDKLPNGESYQDAKNRAGDFMYEIDRKHSGENVLIVTHGMFLEVLPAIVEGADAKKSKHFVDTLDPQKGEVCEYEFVSLPHNENYELDLHRPYIDNVELLDKRGNELKRIPEVFDCWFESGSMPYAQFHYPFENKKNFEEKFYPANFIAEGLDQTRGWFYTLLVLGVGLFGKSPYEEVVVNGLILAEDGKKMSKSLNNYPDIMYVVDKYGADSLRYYLMSSPAVKAEDLNFSEKGVDEVSKKVISKLSNVVSFYEMYESEKTNENLNQSEHILDKWILLRLNVLGNVITESLDINRIDAATRPILDFIDDLSVWYLRRSRDRFKSEDTKDRNDALRTTRFVLKELAKYIAPFMPFFAEHLYLKLKSNDGPESVHLCEWPHPAKASGGDDEIVKNMEETRKIVSLALEKRMAAGIKVRQPLARLKIKDLRLKNKKEYLELIKDEVNVKEIEFAPTREAVGGPTESVGHDLESEVELYTEITEELRKEGNVRELIRAIQDLRKQKNLKPQDVVNLLIETDEKGKVFLNSVVEEIKKPTNISEIKFESNNGTEVSAGDITFKMSLS